MGPFSPKATSTEYHGGSIAVQCDRSCLGFVGVVVLASVTRVDLVYSPVFLLSMLLRQWIFPSSFDYLCISSLSLLVLTFVRNLRIYFSDNHIIQPVVQLGQFLCLKELGLWRLRDQRKLSCAHSSHDVQQYTSESFSTWRLLHLLLSSSHRL